MRRGGWSGLLALALGLVLSSIPGVAAPARGAPADSAAVRAAIDAGNAAFIRAWQTGDADLFASLFAEDGAMLRPGGDLTVGRGNIRSRMRDVFKQVRMTDGTIVPTDVFLIGDTAYETGAWNFTIGPIGSTTSEPDSGSYIEIWKRDAAGAWKMWRDIGVPRGSAPGMPASPPSRRAETEHGARVKAIHFGKLVDGKGRTIPDALVLVDGDRIVSVGEFSKSRIPDDAERHDLTRLTGIPGLIDVHTHMSYWWDRAPGSRPWQQLDARPPMQTMYLAEENARKTLETGVTTVRDLGSFQYMDIAMRDLINRGAMVGPRMFVAGYGLYPTITPYRDAPQPPSGGSPTGWSRCCARRDSSSRRAPTSSRCTDRPAAPTM